MCLYMVLCKIFRVFVGSFVRKPSYILREGYMQNSTQTQLIYMRNRWRFGAKFGGRNAVPFRPTRYGFVGLRFQDGAYLFWDGQVAFLALLIVALRYRHNSAHNSADPMDGRVFIIALFSAKCASRGGPSNYTVVRCSDWAPVRVVVVC